jgi:hypothetical protein
LSASQQRTFSEGKPYDTTETYGAGSIKNFGSDRIRARKIENGVELTLKPTEICVRTR